MQRRSFDILRRAGGFRLALIFYATLIPGFPLVVFVMAGLSLDRARELFVVWSRGALAMLLAPVAMGMFPWLMAWVAPVSVGPLAGTEQHLVRTRLKRTRE